MTTLPDPRIRHVYHVEATAGEPLDVGEVIGGRRRVIPMTGEQFTGPELRGLLLSGTSADWQLVRPDGTAIGDIPLNKGVFISVGGRSSGGVAYDTYIVE
jgi:hypothetical protein